MYHASDPRSALAAAPRTAAPPAGQAAAADYVRFHDLPPTQTAEGLRSWYGRGQNFIIGYHDAEAGAVLRRSAQADEYVLLIPDKGPGAEIRWGDTVLEVPGHSLSFIPSGDSQITIRGKARVITMLTPRAEDLAAICANAAAYAVPHANIPPFTPWPEARERRIHSYSLEVAPTPGRFGRIFRCSTFMVNFLEPKNGPRDTSKMSPHHHDDFEQCSLALAGSFIHHLRWPWTTDMAEWREDEHAVCGSPSIAVIPPPVIHTSQATDPGLNLLVDVFAPPRMDFSSKPGWILNEEDYPMPAAAGR
jgi:hypothetical protein